MATKTKIKILDNADLRIEIDRLYELTNQVHLAKWAINCAKHVLIHFNSGEVDMIEIENQFKTIELWQNGKASVHEVRQSGFKIHAIAKQSKTELAKTAYRTYWASYWGWTHERECNGL